MVHAEAEGRNGRPTSGPARWCCVPAQRGGSQFRNTGFPDGQPLKSVGALGRLGFGDNGDMGDSSQQNDCSCWWEPTAHGPVQWVSRRSPRQQRQPAASPGNLREMQIPGPLPRRPDDKHHGQGLSSLNPQAHPAILSFPDYMYQHVSTCIQHVPRPHCISCSAR